MASLGAKSGSRVRAVAFGCVPIADHAETRARLNDLCEVLTEVLGVVIRPHRAPSPAALASAYKAGRVQLVWSSAALFLGEPALLGAVPLDQCVRAGRSSYLGCLFVPATSTIMTPDDLADARVAWVAESSAAGYLFPCVSLAERGTPASSLFSKESFLGSYAAVLDSVHRGDADVGATFAVFENDQLRQASWASSDAHAHPYRIVLRSSPIPSDMIVVAPETLAQIPDDPAVRLEHLHERPRAAALMRQILGADTFRRIDPEELRQARDLVRDVQHSLVAG